MYFYLLLFFSKAIFWGEDWDPQKMLGTPIWSDMWVPGPRMKNPSAIPVHGNLIRTLPRTGRRCPGVSTECNSCYQLDSFDPYTVPNKEYEELIKKLMVKNCKWKE